MPFRQTDKTDMLKYFHMSDLPPPSFHVRLILQLSDHFCEQFVPLLLGGGGGCLFVGSYHLPVKLDAIVLGV